MLKKFLDLGFKSTILCIRDRIKHTILYHKYKFDKWHIEASLNCKLYQRQVVHIVNNLDNIDCCIELGCGLGHTLQGISVPKKIGIDFSQSTIKGAKDLNSSNNITFIHGSFEKINRVIEDNKKVLLLMINWTHGLETDILIDEIKKLNISYLLLDCIKDNIKEGYQFHHSIDKLNEHFEIVNSIDSVDKIRQFVLLKI